MKKIAIVSCYFKNNYGSQLQAYATQAAIEKIGCETQTISVKDNIDFKKGKRKYYLKQLFNFDFIKSKFGMIKFKIDKKINGNLKVNIAKRNAKFNEFKKIYKMSSDYKTYEQLAEASKQYDSVLVGSDQLWLPVNVVADYYTLNWVPNDVNKISYATSFGISTIPEKYKNDYKKFLNRIDFLSVREDRGVKIIKEITEKDAALVCDPTMLLSKDEWLEIQPKERIINEKYIFCYFLGKNIEHRKFVENLKKKTGYKIVAINHSDEYVKYDDKYADDILYEVGPGEFVNLIRNAEYICTDSFHGTVFSIINNVKFFTFERFKNKNSKMSTNSRIYSLLELFNLKERLLVGNEDIDNVMKMDLNTEEINKILEDFKSKSMQFLSEAVLK